MAAENLADVRAVQGYFNRRVASMVAARGRQVVAWDEVIDAGMEEGWIIQAWRGVTMRDRVTAAGNRVLLSAPYYLDLHYPTDIHYGFDPAAEQSELIDREDALIADPRFEHIAGGLRWTEQWREGAVDIAAAENGAEGDAASGQETLLLGAEACLWSELVTADTLELRLFSRLPALAERFWSAATLTSAEEVNRRQDAFLDRQLPLAGIDLAAQAERRWRDAGIDEFWSELVRMLEPIKWYGRLLGMEALAARIAGSEMPQARPYDLASPLDQLIDHLPVESRSARELAALCLLSAEADGAGDTALALLRQRLQVFAQLGAASVEAPQGLGPLAEKLAELGLLLEHRLAGRAATPDQLRELMRPQGEFMLALPPTLWHWLLSP